MEKGEGVHDVPRSHQRSERQPDLQLLNSIQAAEQEADSAFRTEESMFESKTRKVTEKLKEGVNRR